MKHYDIVIVGAGPAGLAAADESAQRGLSVLLVDENHQPGGQYLRHPPATFQRKSTLSAKQEHIAQAPFSVCDHPRVTYLSGAVVWDFPEPLVIAYSGEQGSGRARATSVVLATGACERAVPFPGWTLPGVMTAGGVQNLLKGQRIAPARSAVVAGNGPLLLATAANLLQAGVEVRAVVDSAPFTGRGWRRAHKLALFPKLARLALGYLAALKKAGVPLMTNHAVTSARGSYCLESVEVASLDREGKPDSGQSQSFEAEMLVTGFGLTPAAELARLCGCDHRYDVDYVAWVPQRSDELETSVTNVFAAGDGAGIGGFEMAKVEGALAGCVAAARSGKSSNDIVSRIALLQKQRHRLQRFQRELMSIYRSNLDTLELLKDDTVICRCEEVTWEAIQRCMHNGRTSMTQLKAATRCGMGRCQGRNCQGTVAAIAARASSESVGAQGWPRARPPARLVTVESLLSEELPPPCLPADPHGPRNRKD